DVPNGVGHRQHGQAEGQRDALEADLGAGVDRGATAAEDEPEGPEELSGETPVDGLHVWCSSQTNSLSRSWQNRRPGTGTPARSRHRAARAPVRRTRDVRPSPWDARPLCPRHLAGMVGATDDEEQGDGRGIDYPGSGGL